MQVRIDLVNQGESIGRYEIERILGRGSVGIVYQALDPLIGRKVALKTLRTDLDKDAAEEFQQRFLREARAVGKLSHPNIITIFDVGQDGDTVFIAMEYVKGATLEEFISINPNLDTQRAVDLSATLADAIDYAHREGVIHRDVKPANIMLTTTEIPKITDFGIARLGASELTVEGSLLGTPYYMSPEQLQGKKVDSRTDLFALGVILFQLVTGERPFTGNTLLKIMGAIIERPAPDPKILHPGIPVELSNIIKKSLSKNPDGRFQTGKEMSEALRSLDIQPEEEDLGQATMVQTSLNNLKEIRGSLKFKDSDRLVHVRMSSELLIGRDAMCDIHLFDPRVSRKHAIVNLDDDGVRFTDLNSSNGSACNNDRVVTPVKLKDGDVLSIGGKSHLLVRIKGESDKPQSVALISGGEEFLLTKGTVRFGRDAKQVDIRIADQAAARMHARIECTFTLPIIKSESVHAQLIVNDEKVTSAPLIEGTKIQIGNTHMEWINCK